uniref:hypothetical protein n=1 Tax=Flavobacterium sp. TaxID=239 RepID=UPI00404A0CE9
MKKIFLIITLLFTCFQIQAQEKAEPTKEETFKFIISMLDNITKTSEQGDFTKYSIVDFDEIKYTITLKSERNMIFSETENHIVTFLSYLNLADLNSFLLNEENLFIKCYFNKEYRASMEYNKVDKLNRPLSSTNKSYTEKSAEFIVKNNSDLKKLEKALNHWIKLMGNKVNTSLFDE